MKKLFLLAGVAALAACGGNDADTVVEDDGIATLDDSASDMTATPAGPGTYTAYDTSGTMLGTTQANADGSYTNTDASGASVSGTWSASGDQLCFDPDGTGGDLDQKCWNEGGEGMNGRTVYNSDAGETIEIAYDPA